MGKPPKLAISPTERIDAIADITGRRSAAELRILNEISAHASSSTGLAWPGVQTLADASRVTRRHAQRLLRRLADDGVLFVELGGRGQADANRYGIVAPAEGRHLGRHLRRPEGRRETSPEPGNQETKSCARSAPEQTDNQRRGPAKGLEALAREIDRAAYTTWIEPLEVRERAGGGVDVVCPSRMHLDRVKNYYGDRLRHVLGKGLEYSLREVSQQRPNPVADVEASVRQQEVDPEPTMAAAGQLLLDLPGKHAPSAPGSTKADLTDELVGALPVPAAGSRDVWDARFEAWVLAYGRQIGVRVPVRLYVRIWASGARSARLSYRLPGAGRTMRAQTWTIGRFPAVRMEWVRQQAQASVVAVAAGLHVRDCARRRSVPPARAAVQLRLDVHAEPAVLPESIGAPGSTRPARQEARADA